MGKKKKNNEGGQNETKKDKLPVTTTVFKVKLHCRCEGCYRDTTRKIRKIVTNTEGYGRITIDQEKDLVTVTGAIDMKALGEKLSKKLKKDFEIIPPKKDDKNKEKGDDSVDTGENDGGGGGDKGKMQVLLDGYPYPYPLMLDQVIIMDHLPYTSSEAPQVLSAEDPNSGSRLLCLYFLFSIFLYFLAWKD